MTPEVSRAFARYNRWMNGKVYAAAARLTDEDRKRELFNHQTHHRGQLRNLLFQAGHDPGATDMFAMLQEEAQRAAG